MTRLALRRLAAAASAAVLALVSAGCRGPERDDGTVTRAAVPAAAAQPGSARIEAVMADPADLPDERGEWVRVRNSGTVPLALRGWQMASGSDAPHAIAAALVVVPGGTAVLARTADVRVDGRAPDYVYGGGIALANGRDWVALRDTAGRTADSVAWSAARRGVAMGDDLLQRRAPSSSVTVAVPGVAAVPGVPGVPSVPPVPGPAGAAAAAPLVVRVLDVGQGDAVLVENGGSRVLVDGGPDAASLARHLDALALDGQTIDVVVISHPHLDHYNGLRELFRSRRGITVRYLFDARDPSPNRTLAALRDSVAARARRGVLEWRDADDPCGDGRPACAITLRGGARLVVMRPWPSDTAGPNNRSVAVRLASADSTFSMWLAGDAEHEAIAWMERSGYPMDVDVLKANHHGSCNGLTASYLRRTSPALVVMSLAGANDYGHVHTQTTALLREAGIPWLRTDQNGTITITAPGRDGQAWSVATERGARSMTGPSDRASRAAECRTR